MTKPVTCRLRVRVQPNAARSEITGWYDGGIRVRTTAPPTKGRANLAVAGMLAGALDLPGTAVGVIRGQRSRDKVVEVAGIDGAELLRRLQELMTSQGNAGTFR